MASVGKAEAFPLVSRAGRKITRHGVGEFRILREPCGQFENADTAVGSAGSVQAVAEIDVVRLDVEEMGYGHAGLGVHFPSGADECSTADVERARAAMAGTARHVPRIRLHELDEFRGEAEMLVDELQVHGLVPLASGVGAGDDGDGAVVVEADFRVVCGRAECDLGVARYPDAAQPPALSRCPSPL